jgi:hypothetical protein
MRRRHLLPLLLLLALGASACRVRTTVDVAVAEDGSGEVAVTLRLDAEALARVPDIDDDGTSGLADLAALVRTEDLGEAGWTVGEPAESGEGGAALRVTRPFGTPEEADTILAELTGPSGALRDLDVSRSTSFGGTELGFSGTADLSDGLEAFGDEGLAAALDGEPLGQDAAAIEEAAGVPLAEAVTFEVTADLDGDATSWQPRLGDPPLAMAAATTAYDVPVLVLTAVAVAAALALAVVLLMRLLRSRRRA